MIQALKNLFGIGPAVDYKQMAKEGAQIIDVRSKGEFNSGHLKGSVNMPLDSLSNNYGKLKKDKPIITCCASGMRSGQAKNMLKNNGFANVHNGGGWMSLQNKLR